MTETSELAGVGTAYLLSSSDELGDDESFVLHGIALGEGDLTVGKSQKKKIWPAEALREAASTLEGQPLVRDHLNNTEGKVGEVTEAEYRPGVGVIYEAEIAPHYEELAQDVEAGLMEVSVRAYHAPDEELEEDEENDALVVEDVYFDNLSLVNKGASPSNTAEPGPIEDAVGDMAAVESSASVGGETATAVLSRSVDVESVNTRPVSDEEDAVSEENSESSTDESESEDSEDVEEILEEEQETESMTDEEELEEEADDLEDEEDIDDGASELSDEEVEEELDEMDEALEEEVDDLEEDLDEDLEDEDLEESTESDVDEDADELGQEDEADLEEDEPVSEPDVATVLTTSDLGQAESLSTVHSTNMNINYEEYSAEDLGDELDLDEPVVVEQSDLESLSERAEKADSVESELEQLSDKLDEQDDARAVVSELSEEEIDLVTDETETTVVSAELAEAVDEVTSIYAEELAEYSPWDAEELADKFSPLELKGKIDEHEEAELSASIEDTEPEPEAGDASNEELSETEEELEAEAEAEERREKYADELEAAGWERQAEKVRSGELDPFEE